MQAYDLITFDPVGAVRSVPAGTKVTMTGLTNGVPYRFRVRAVNSVGKGAWSNGSNPVTPMVPVTAPDASQLTVTGLANGTRYRFRVRALNEVGAGTYSTTSAAVTPMAVPGTPPSVTATSGANGGALTVTVRWAAPNNGGSPIVAYYVTRQQLNARGAAVGAPVTATFSARTLSTTFTASRTVARNTRFRFTVQAVNEVGLGSGRSVIGTVR